jgi:hypothetical protein
MSGPNIANPYGNARTPKSYNENSNNNGHAKSPGVYVGVVKKNDDTQNMGRLKVYIKEFGGNPDIDTSWITVSYASPFAGSTSIYNQGSNVTEYEDTMKSYGFWAVPPDLDTEVLVAFNAGKTSDGYWFACLYQRGTQVSVPGIPSKNTYGGENKPAAPKNKKDSNPDLEKYVEHKPMSDALKKQGLEKDLLRGLTSSSATRESPSKVLGILTPGQHQFVMDDGDKDGNNKLIRLRTTNGTQLLLDDAGGHIYLITKDGQNWVELSNDGQIHIYGDSDINIRSKSNINLFADNDVNIEAGRSINMNAKEGSLQIQAGSDLNSSVKGSTRLTSVMSSHIYSGTAHYETAGVIHMNGPDAELAAAIQAYKLAVNHGVTESICNVVPEHEPWFGHSGAINPVGPGNQQMKIDPKPNETPRQPTATETGAPINIDSDKQEEVNLEEAVTSDAAVGAIKKSNGYNPVNTNDAGTQSGGYGSDMLTSTVSTASNTGNIEDMGLG